MRSRLPIRIGEADAIGASGEDAQHDRGPSGGISSSSRTPKSAQATAAPNASATARCDHRRVERQAQRASIEPGQPPAERGEPTPARSAGPSGSRAASTGTRESATNEEMLTAMAQDEAELPKQAPGGARQERDRDEDRNEGGRWWRPRRKKTWRVPSTAARAARERRAPAALDGSRARRWNRRRSCR